MFRACVRVPERERKKKRRLLINLILGDFYIYIRPKMRTGLMILFGCVLDMLFRHVRTPAGSGLPCSPLWYVHLSLSFSHLLPYFSSFSGAFLDLK